MVTRVLSRYYFNVRVPICIHLCFHQWMCAYECVREGKRENAVNVQLIRKLPSFASPNLISLMNYTNKFPAQVNFSHQLCKQRGFRIIKAAGVNIPPIQSGELRPREKPGFFHIWICRRAGSDKLNTRAASRQPHVRNDFDSRNDLAVLIYEDVHDETEKKITPFLCNVIACELISCSPDRAQNLFAKRSS